MKDRDREQMPQINKQSRLPKDQEERSTWIENKAWNFVFEEGGISHTILEESGNITLSKAIYRYYPGGMKALRPVLLDKYAQYLNELSDNEYHLYVTTVKEPKEIITLGDSNQIRRSRVGLSMEANLRYSIANIRALIFNKHPSIKSEIESTNYIESQRHINKTEKDILDTILRDSDLVKQISNIQYGKSKYPPKYSAFGNNVKFTIYNTFSQYGLYESELNRYFERWLSLKERKEDREKAPSQTILFQTQNTSTEILPASHEDGRSMFKRLDTGEINFNDVNPFIITDNYRRKRRVGDYIYLSPDVRLPFNQKCEDSLKKNGRILAIPRSDEAYEYTWLEIYPVENGVAFGDQLLQSAQYLSSENRFESRHWYGLEKQILFDFLKGKVNSRNTTLPTFQSEFTKNRIGTHLFSYTFDGHVIHATVPFPKHIGPGKKLDIYSSIDINNKVVWITGYDDINGEIIFKRALTGPVFGHEYIRLLTLKETESLHKKQFLTDIENSINSLEYQNLITLFGSSRAVDILYAIRPEFRGMPVETVKGVLSEYLGDFMLQRRPLEIGDIEAGIDLLNNPDFSESLYEVMIDDCLEYIYKIREENPDMATWDIVNYYLQFFHENTSHLQNPDLNLVISRVIEYYEGVLTIPLPLRFVESIKEGRDFPDINQQVNIQKIMDKKRILNADIMGSGKSATPLIAKELLKIDKVLLVVPSNVESTWMKYLSDERQIGGYYKSGMAPKVLLIENQNDLDKNFDEFEFVIISQEKLNERYANALLKFDYKMLVVDESHKLKNLADGIRASHLINLSEKIEDDDNYLVLLSGTPVPNKIQDVAIYLKLFYPDRFKDVEDSDLITSIIKGDIIDLRSLLIPRMQRKSSLKGLNLPELKEESFYTDLDGYEKEVYEILLDEDEMSASDKLRILRQFLLNPNSLDLLPYSQNSKASQLGQLLREDFNTKNRVSLFINGYVNGVIRGEETIFDNLNLPDHIQVRIVDGSNGSERDAIQEEFNTADYPILLVVSGQTADVGRDFSGSEANFFYNLPWTEYDRQQQLYRSYREGRKTPLKSTSLITRGTLEEGIQWYIQAKYNAVEKLLSGIPVTELEKRLLIKSESNPEDALEVNEELAKYYFSTWERMVKFFSYVQEIGEEDFQQFLKKYGEEYANNYTILENKSYFANANRVVGTLLDNLISTKGEDRNTSILDLASGPEVLRKHAPRNIENRIVSLDINQRHFGKTFESKKVAASFLKLPFENNAFSYATMTLAWHYTKYSLMEKNYERIESLLEANRVLSVGGKLLITNMYSLEIRDEESFSKMLDLIGFKIIPEYSGEAMSGDKFKVNIYTLEKTQGVNASASDIVSQLDRETLKGIKFKKQREKIRSSKQILNTFSLNGHNHRVVLNELDSQLFEEEQRIYAEAYDLKRQYITYDKIPPEVVLQNGFGRIKVGKNYRLFKSLPNSSGIVVVR